MIAAERLAVEAMGRLVPSGRPIVAVSDRAFGNSRWVGWIARKGWYFVQRLSGNFFIEFADYIGQLSDLPIRRGAKARDWGYGVGGDANPMAVRLISVWAPGAEEPWYLVTNMEDIPYRIVRLYQRRMWIEAMFRDPKNARLGLGLDAVRLSEPARHDRHFIILALAHLFLSAFGAAAEARGLDRLLKANTVATRVLSLASMGHRTMQYMRCTMSSAFESLSLLPT